MQGKDDTKNEFSLAGVLVGHNDLITSIATGNPQKENEDSNVLITGSRDRTLMIWKLSDAEIEEDVDPNGKRFAGVPFKSLTGHSHFVSDVALSIDNMYALSASWDKTLRLWDLRTGKTSRIFNGHTKEVLSVTFSGDNRQIISAGADRTFKLWNTLADCKFTNDQNNHSDWVSCVRYSPVAKNPYFATGGWDGRLKIWNQNFSIRYSFKAHQDNINSVAIAPLGSYIATGGKENNVKVWDLNDLTEEFRELKAGSSINKVSFNPKMQWVAAATELGVKIFDLNTDQETPFADIYVEKPKPKKEGKVRSGSDRFACTAIAWNATGRKLFAAFSDNIIRVYHVGVESQ